MFLKKKGQATMEYAAGIAGAALLVGTILTAAFNSGGKTQAERANSFLNAAGDDYPDYYDAAATNVDHYKQSFSNSEVDADVYAQKTQVKKGGFTQDYSKQAVSTVSVSAERHDALE